MAKQNVYADRVINVFVTGGIVRLDLGTLDRPADGKEPPRLEPTDRLIMPLEGFIASVQLAQQALQAMAQRNQQAAGAAAGKAGEDAKAPQP